jgi:hypothetical protein
LEELALSYTEAGFLCPASFFNTTCFLGAIVGPVVTGYIREVTGSFAASLWAAAVFWPALGPSPR